MIKRSHLIFIAVFLVAFSYFSATSVGEDNDVLRISFPMSKPATSYDPTRIAFAADYVFLQNIFGTLVQMSPKTGEITSGLAKKFWWDQNKLFLELRSNIRTASNEVINAEDVVFSLKRYIKLSNNKAFKDLICPSGLTENLNKSCKRISNNKNIVVLDFVEKNASILQMLSGVDFSIVPKQSVDEVSLRIINYRETTGPFYVYKDDKNGAINLRVNKNHYLYCDTNNGPLQC